MPLYEYECLQCHKHVERIQKFSDPEITLCPKCGGKLERLLSAPAVQFKGSGWYVSDYGAGNKSGGLSEKKASGESKTSEESKSSGESTSSDSGSSSSESKTESKVETKSESKTAAGPSVSGKE